MTQIDMKKMKEIATRFPEPVRSLILSEPNMINVRDFILKLATWERLLRMNMARGLK